ncbi:MAG: Zn-dependent alcohol dehydrogenase [Chloroflexi bacterium]|nr:Zn-dependent alcohol dehydrogenase [Chloroflexota bacterium]
MKAAVLYQAGQPLVIEDVELDPPKAGEVHIKIGAAGICRSDLHVIKGEANHLMPAVLGHEGSGTVLDVGPGVTRVKPGDRVILSFVPYCGHCHFCLTNRANLCDRHQATPGTLLDGTTRLHKGTQRIHHYGKVACFAQEAVVPETGCIPVAPDFPLPQAALIGCCVTTGVGAAIYNARITPGSTVAVVGCGGVGLNVVQGARLQNAGKIIAVDISEGKLEFAMRFGATHSVNPTVQDPVAAVKELTGGLGADYTFEVFGSGETVQTAFNAARKGGTVVVVGLAPAGEYASIDPIALVRQEKTLKGSYYGSARPVTDMPVMVQLYQSGKIDIDGLITRTYRLEDINQAYKDIDGSDVGRGVITQF